MTGIICALGDAHLDVVVRVTAPIAPDTDTPARTVLSVGGQAANVAAWVAALGGRGRLIAARGTDLAAALVAAELDRRGVELVGPVLDGRTGIVVSLSDSATGGTRSMLTDRGVGPQLPGGAVDPGWLAGCSWLHLPGYSLLAGAVRGAALAAADAARDHGAKLSVDLSSTAAIADHGVPAFRALLTELAPDVVFATAAEASLIGDLHGELPSTELVVKRGAGGVRIGSRHYPAVPATLADSTGAGDAFAAGFLLDGVHAGLAAAARAVATMGAMP